MAVAAVVAAVALAVGAAVVAVEVDVAVVRAAWCNIRSIVHKFDRIGT